MADQLAGRLRRLAALAGLGGLAGLGCLAGLSALGGQAVFSAGLAWHDGLAGMLASVWKVWQSQSKVPEIKSSNVTKI